MNSNVGLGLDSPLHKSFFAWSRAIGGRVKKPIWLVVLVIGSSICFAPWSVFCQSQGKQDATTPAVPLSGEQSLQLTHLVFATWNPDDCYEGQWSVFSVKVENKGNEDLTVSAIDIKWWRQIPGEIEYIARTEHINIDPGGGRTVTVAPQETKNIFLRKEKVSGVGNWRGDMTVYTDAGSLYTQAYIVIREAETNLKLQLELEPEPVIEIEPVPASEPVEIDLELIKDTMEFSASSFTVGSEIEIAASVKNSGKKELSSVEVEFQINGESAGKVEMQALDTGEKKRVMYRWIPWQPVRYLIRVIVDPGEKFDEIDEDNNRDSRSVLILAK